MVSRYKLKTSHALPFVYSLTKMILRISVKRASLLGLLLLSLVLFAGSADAAMFKDLTKSGSDIFTGMREIIYAVSGFGIVGVAIGGFFGNLNWKWLSAIIIGLLVIATTAGILKYMTESELEGSAIEITDSLKNAK